MLFPAKVLPVMTRLAVVEEEQLKLALAAPPSVAPNVAELVEALPEKVELVIFSGLV
jgi:hypothetical protein